MKYLAVLILAPSLLLAQGPETPPGPPGPTQKSLQEIWDELQSTQSVVASQSSQIAALIDGQLQLADTLADLQANLAELQGTQNALDGAVAAVANSQSDFAEVIHSLGVSLGLTYQWAGLGAVDPFTDIQSSSWKSAAGTDTVSWFAFARPAIPSSGQDAGLVITRLDHQTAGVTDAVLEEGANIFVWAPSIAIRPDSGRPGVAYLRNGSRSGTSYELVYAELNALGFWNSSTVATLTGPVFGSTNFGDALPRPELILDDSDNAPRIALVSQGELIHWESTRNAGFPLSFNWFRDDSGITGLDIEINFVAPGQVVTTSTATGEIHHRIRTGSWSQTLLNDLNAPLIASRIASDGSLLFLAGDTLYQRKDGSTSTLLRLDATPSSAALSGSGAGEMLVVNLSGVLHFAETTTSGGWQKSLIPTDGNLSDPIDLWPTSSGPRVGFSTWSSLVSGSVLYHVTPQTTTLLSRNFTNP